MDIDGAFDNTLFLPTEKAANEHGVLPTFTRWINAMLKSRKSKIGSDDVLVSVDELIK